MYFLFYSTYWIVTDCSWQWTFDKKQNSWCLTWPKCFLYSEELFLLTPYEWLANFTNYYKVIINFIFHKTTTTTSNTSLEKSCCTGSFTLVSSNSFTTFNLLVGFFINRKACSSGVPKDRLDDGMFNNCWPVAVEREREKNMSWQHTRIACKR